MIQAFALGTCSSCLSLMDLDHKGNIVEHSTSRWAKYLICLGSGRPPREEKRKEEAKA